jgi:hypothetical protein
MLFSIRLLDHYMQAFKQKRQEYFWRARLPSLHYNTKGLTSIPVKFPSMSFFVFLTLVTIKEKAGI